ncbi:MAG TPA: carbohydrate-binding domain-containing protein [Candidatus Dwaynia gallinarum]|nr:carbohydrate-binding domain-containing protein [Candidatus Dwaynia gallinarum]
MKRDKYKKFLGVALSTMFLFGLSSCTNTNASATNNVTQSSVSTDNSNQPMPRMMNVSLEGVDLNAELTSSVVDKEIKNKDKEVNYDRNTSTIITLNGDSISFQGEGVTVGNSTVTITQAGTYVISGNLNNGQIIVDAADTDDVRIVLENVNIHSETSAAIYVRNADKLIVTLPSGTTNTLSGGSTYENIDENNIDGVIFSKDDLTINGEGTLNINANYKHGIVSKNDLNIVGGTFNINSVSQALSGKDAVKIYGGVFNIESQGKGIKSENVDETEKGNIYITGGEFNLNTVDDALHTSGSIVIDEGNFTIKTEDDGMHADKDLVINGGNINITESYEGLEGYKVVINGGDVNIVASDDGINAANPESTNTVEVIPDTTNTTTTQEATQNTTNNMNTVPVPSTDTNAVPVPPTDGNTMVPGKMGRPNTDNGMINDPSAYIKITGGNTTINASGDGIDSNGSFLVTGGSLFVSGALTRGDAAIDYNGGAKIEGGTVVAVGGIGMNQSFGSESTQYSISYSVNAQVSENNAVKLIDDSGNVVVSWENPPKAYSSVLISSPELKQNGNYKLQTGSDTIELILQNVVTTNISQGMGMGGRGQRGERPQELPVNPNTSGTTETQTTGSF